MQASPYLMKPSYMRGVCLLLAIIVLQTVLTISPRAATFIVTNANDSGVGSLRQVVANANGNAGFDTVEFQLGGPAKITLQSPIVLSTEMEIIGSGDLEIEISGDIGNDGSPDTQLFQITGSETGMVTLKNLRLSYGAGFGGGAVWISNSGTVVRIESCVVEDCEVTVDGGAILNGDGTTPGGHLTVIGCDLLNNSATNNGGAIATYEGATEILYSTITTNNAYRGGGIYADSSAKTVLTETGLSENLASHSGGGLHSSGETLVRRSSFYDNTADTFGGGVFFGDGTATLLNSTFAENATESSGGGMFVSDTAVSSASCTFVLNTADSDDSGIGGGGGIYVSPGAATMALVNTCVAGNFDTPNNAGILPDHPDVHGSFTSNGHNLIGDSTGATGFTDGVNGDIVGSGASPVDPKISGITSASGTTAYPTLNASSPLLGAGDESALGSAPYVSAVHPVDQLGIPRVVDGAMEIGSVEKAVIYRVSDTGDVLTSNTLRERIDSINSFGEYSHIVFDQQIFAVEQQEIFLTGGELEITQAMAICAPEVGVIINAQNNSRVVKVNTPGFADQVLLKNIQLRNGNTSAFTNLDALGAGIWVNGGDLVLRNCMIRGCYTPESGAGVAAGGGAGAFLTLIDCRIGNNDADAAGGGVCILDGEGTMTRTTLSNNTAGQRGGGVYSSGEMEIVNSTISGNTADWEGGGIYLQHQLLTSTMLNCTITNNTADDDNSGGESGGGIFLVQGDLEVTNTIIAENFAPGGTPQDVDGAFTDGGSNLIGVSDGSTGFTTSTLVGTLISPRDPRLEPLADNGGVGLTHMPLPQSLVIAAGDDSALSGVEIDQLQNPRIQDSRSDIGAVEYLRHVVTISQIDDAAEEYGVEARFELTRNNAQGELPVLLSLAGTASDSDFTVSTSAGTFVKTSSFWTATFPETIDEMEVSLLPVDDEIVEGLETVTAEVVATSTFAAPDPDSDSDVAEITDNDFLVTNTNDTGGGSLRGALAALSPLPSGDIFFDETGVFATPQTITVKSAELVINGDHDINGPACGVTLDGNNSSRPLAVTGSGSGTVTLQKLVLTEGGPLLNGGILEVGGNSSVLMRECVISNGNVFSNGGGIHLKDSADLTLINSLVYNNSADDSGGGIAHFSTGTLQITNSTISGNRSDAGGGGISAFDGSTQLIYSTITQNTADDLDTGTYSGGGILASGISNVELRGCIVAENFDTPANGGSNPLDPDLRNLASGVLDTLGANIIGVENRDLGGGTNFPAGSPHGTVNGNGDIIGDFAKPLDPHLLPLANNGGLAMTHALANGSPALDHGANSTPVVTDQRGAPRLSNARVDSGSYEWQKEPYSFWAGYSFPCDATPAEKAEDFDYDNDLITNLWEHLLGLDPMTPDAAQVLHMTHDATEITLTVNVSTIASPQYDVEILWRENLEPGDWFPAVLSDSEEDTLEGENLTELLFLIDKDTYDSQYFRLNKIRAPMASL